MIPCYELCVVQPSCPVCDEWMAKLNVAFFASFIICPASSLCVSELLFQSEHVLSEVALINSSFLSVGHKEEEELRRRKKFKIVPLTLTFVTCGLLSSLHLHLPIPRFSTSQSILLSNPIPQISKLAPFPSHVSSLCRRLEAQTCFWPRLCFCPSFPKSKEKNREEETVGTKWRNKLRTKWSGRVLKAHAKY